MRFFGVGRINLVFLSVNLLLLTASLSATDIFVGPTAAGSGNCSSTGNRCSVSQGINTYVNNTSATIHFADGTYTSGIDLIKSGASPSSRLTLQCDNGISSATVAIGKCKFTGSGFIIEANNVDVVGFDIGGNPNMNVGLDSVANGGSTGNSVHYIGNYVHDLGQNVRNSAGVLGCPEAGAITGQTGISDGQVLRNIVARYGTGSFSTGCNTAQGIYFDSAAMTRIENNIVAQTPSGNITVRLGCNYVVSNNVMIGGSAGLILSDGPSCPAGSVGLSTFNNNYMGNHSTSHVFWVGGRQRCSSGTQNFFGSNVTDGVGTDRNASFSCDILSPGAFTHQAGALFFVNYQTNGSGDYHLGAGSVGVGTGTKSCVSGGLTPCTPTIDFDGSARAASLSLAVYEPTLSATTLPSAPTGLTAVVQ